MNKVITISREFGSGGRELGERLADALQIPCYDYEIIEMIAEHHGWLSPSKRGSSSLLRRGLRNCGPLAAYVSCRFGK